MSYGFDEFIQLNRTFHDLALNEGNGGDDELFRLMRQDKPTQWPDLLKERRVVLLSEAGSGKTEEIRHVCRDLRLQGKSAFFLRIEHLARDFEASFEEGTSEEFNDWVSSSREGWLLLDSVDEARLQHPKDFERAISAIGRRLRSVLQRVHIIITSRSEAWRPNTDLLLCETNLPWIRPTTISEEDQESDEAYTSSNAAASQKRKSIYRMVTLDDLADEQIDRFAKAKGISDIPAFTKALDRADARSFTTRPLDLAEIIEFWIANDRVGSRLELLRASIDKRLEERDQDRADANPISKDRIRDGARLVAAASTLTKEPAIRVPDGQKNGRGLDIKQVLTDWNDTDCRILLTRPIFDEGIYGTVRFHHRSVREFLTAEWLNSLLVDEGSRARIENLFFRRQYGVEVIIPTMRPILPWLAIFDQRILDYVIRVAPEILFEGGDPAQLPLETRAQILREACEQLIQPAHGRSTTEYSAVQRFTNPDLANVISELLDKYKDDDHIVRFLLRMVDQGGIQALAGNAKHFALASKSDYTRLAAIQALVEVGTVQSVAEVRQAFIVERLPFRRSWLVAFLNGLGRTRADVEWLLSALELTDSQQQFEVSPLSDVLSSYVTLLEPVLLTALFEGIAALLSRAPVIELRQYKISKKYSWLTSTAGRALMRMIEYRDPTTLKEPALSILQKLSVAKHDGRGNFHEISNELPQLVCGWSDLNRMLFWHNVSEERIRREREHGERLTDWWHVMILGGYSAFDGSDFIWAIDQITNQSILDDKLVALTLAIQIYHQNGCPPEWRALLNRASADAPEVKAKLLTLLKPPKEAATKFQKQQATWKRQSERRAAKTIQAKQRSREILEGRLTSLRHFGTPGQVSQDQHYLHTQMRSADSQHNHWTEGNWRSLIAFFGEDIARAFRDGAVGYWRQNTPRLRSEGAATNMTLFTTIFGLTGISIEARETETWPSALTTNDAKIATRYALQELNGFPSWLSCLYKSFPSEVLEVILGEIRYELSTETKDKVNHCVLSDVSWYGDWIWDQLAPALLPELRAKRVNVRNFGFLIAILNRSSVDDTAIAAIVSHKANVTRNLTFSPIWFATWVGVDPDAAIPALAARFALQKNPVEQTKLALAFIVSLFGTSSRRSPSRQAYRTVEHIKSLYLLMASYIRQEDDIQRAGKGVFSPSLRDDAQDARDALITFIRETPGKAAFLALLEMTRAHPDEESRPWMGFHAKSKATADADITAWIPSQIREFGKSLIATPMNHRELWYHVVDKLEALKHDLEHGDSSISSILQAVDKETEFRKYIGGWCRDHSAGRYVVPQEEELADAKRPDLRFFGIGFDAPVPAELKLADKWTGPHLFERLEVQLCGDYLRDVRSSRGVFLLVYLGKKSYWDLPDGRRADTFDKLIDELQRHWTVLSAEYPNAEDIRIIGIDLTRRGINAKSKKH